MSFNNGYKCLNDCGWMGTFDEAALWMDQPMCPNRMCQSLDLEPIVLCRTCQADEAQDETGQCMTCCPIQADDPDPFECELRSGT